MSHASPPRRTVDVRAVLDRVRIGVDVPTNRRAIHGATEGEATTDPADPSALDDATIDELATEIERDCPADASREARYEAVVNALSARIDRDPLYKRLAAHAFREGYVHRVADALDCDAPIRGGTESAEAYRDAFVAAIEGGLAAGRLDERLAAYDLDAVASHLVPARDGLLEYMAMETLEERYFLRVEDQPIELPQGFWMRVAMGLALAEPADERAERAREFYDVMSHLRFVPSTPTLFHAGTAHPQLSSCYVTTVADDLDHIFECYGDHAQLSKWSGGIGTDWTNVRATGARIESTGVESTGTVPFLKISNDVTAAINRSGKRRGAACAYLECWHLDFPAFLDLKRNTGDERRRTHDMNTAAWIPDLFVKRVRADEAWTLFSPNEVPDLHGSYGREFEVRYETYEAMAEAGELRQHECVDARELWRTMLTRLFETGHPWLTFKDPCNIRSPQDHAGVINSSNLCTEITLNTAPDETAVCNLGSVNLARHVHVESEANTADGDGAAVSLDRDALADTVQTAMRMLDNVVDLNFYPTEKAERSNLRHRPVGLGVMGLHDALTSVGVPMASERALDVVDEWQELVAYHAILTSSKLAAERGPYESYEGSKWGRGLLPQDTIDLLETERGREIPGPREERLDWEAVREHVAEHGMRNSNTMAIAPTATISTIAGTTPSIEPRYANLYVKSNMSGEFTVVNERLVADLQARGLWTDELRDLLTYHDGTIQEIEAIPEDVRELHRSTFEIDPRHQLDLAARRARWIDQSQSINVFFPSTDGRLLDEVYQHAWALGLKTTYYLRTLGASGIEKTTLDVAAYGRTQTRSGGDETVESGQDTVTDGGARCSLPTVEDETCDACQ